MKSKNSVAVVTCPSIGRGYGFVNDLLAGCEKGVEVLDTFTTAHGVQTFILLFSNNYLPSFRKKVGAMYQNGSAWRDVEVILIEDILEETLEALAGLPAAAVEAPLVFVEGTKLGLVVQSLNWLLSKGQENILLGDVEVGVGKGGKASYFFATRIEDAKHLPQRLRENFPTLDVMLINELQEPLKVFFQFTTSQK